MNEMRMLRWMCGVRKKDKIRNEHVRGSVEVSDRSGTDMCNVWESTCIDCVHELPCVDCTYYL